MYICGLTPGAFPICLSSFHNDVQAFAVLGVSPKNSRRAVCPGLKNPFRSAFANKDRFIRRAIPRHSSKRRSNFTPASSQIAASMRARKRGRDPRLVGRKTTLPLCT